MASWGMFVSGFFVGSAVTAEVIALWNRRRTATCEKDRR